jgi:hypothetical protein
MEDEKRPQEAKLVPNRKIVKDDGKIWKRREAIVKNLPNVAVIVLGGSHDLSEHIPDAEYVGKR